MSFHTAPSRVTQEFVRTHALLHTQARPTDQARPAVKATRAIEAVPDVQRELRRGRLLVVRLMVTLDVVALLFAALLAVVARSQLTAVGDAGGLGVAILDTMVVILPAWLIAIALFDGYDARLVATGPQLYRNVLHASLAAAGLAGAGLYLAGIALSRPFFITLFLVGPLLLLLVRLTARRLTSHAHRRGHFRERVLAVGSTSHVDSIARTLHRDRSLGYDVVGTVLPAYERVGSVEPGEIPVLGQEKDLLELVRTERPSVVLFTPSSAASSEEFRRMAWKLEGQNVRVIVVPGLSEISGDRVSMRPVAGLPLVHMDLPRSLAALRWTKRGFDIIGSALLLLVLAPLLGVLALLVTAHDRGPALFRQERVGRGGETFALLKFRSMVPDAEERLAQVADQSRERDNVVMFKMTDDPRTTSIGRVLRRYSLDELPQLWNVLRGEMSLVGPRPALPREVRKYDSDARRRLAVRPGITGLWQVSGRSDLSWSDTVRLDLFYVDNWSFTQDLLILARTAKAVVASSGAY